MFAHTRSFWFRVTVALCTFAVAHPAFADTAAEKQALKDLDAFLHDDKTRREFSATNPSAQQANGMLEGFPKWAQDEMLAIVMMMMRESKEDAIKHADAYKAGGVAGAKASFSPAVKVRVAALEARLAQDPAFNTPENLKKMKLLIPAFLGRPSS
jgi:hypothetical protein